MTEKSQQMRSSLNQTCIVISKFDPISHVSRIFLFLGGGADTQGNLFSYFNSFNIVQPIDPFNKHTLLVYTLMRWCWTPVIVH